MYLRLLVLVAFLSSGLTISETPRAEGCATPISAEHAVYWGDLHVHTELSFDAYAFGSTATPRDAYQFAEGQPLTLANGSVARIDRPLDFAAVTDHAATFGVAVSKNKHPFSTFRKVSPPWESPVLPSFLGFIHELNE
ncbi:MAG: DUF3604 domain-containing protein [Proteobacteria bacterium]|nr:DUF3604 domain-containing protein [Pseudomonadota bacterium]